MHANHSSFHVRVSEAVSDAAIAFFLVASLGCMIRKQRARGAALALGHNDNVLGRKAVRGVEAESRAATRRFRQEEQLGVVARQTAAHVRHARNQPALVRKRFTGGVGRVSARRPRRIGRVGVGHGHGACDLARRHVAEHLPARIGTRVQTKISVFQQRKANTNIATA